MSTKKTIKKRERRPNFTLKEKSYLADLLLQYRDIIDEKRTGEIFNEKKREAWKQITIKYNSKCVTGPREAENLKILYDRMKQQAKNNDGECLTNTTTKLRLFQSNDHSQNESSGSREDHAISASQNIRREKVQMQDTGGSYCNSDPNDPNRVEPWSDPYDNTAVYFRDIYQQSTIDPTNFVDVSLQEVKCECLNSISETNSCGSQESSTAASPETVKVKKSTISKKPLSLEALKHLYFKKKCRNANLERKRILQDIAHAQEKHNLEMIILRRSLEKQ